jgi:hypothetical protein
MSYLRDHSQEIEFFQGELLPVPAHAFTPFGVPEQFQAAGSEAIQISGRAEKTAFPIPDSLDRPVGAIGDDRHTHCQGLGDYARQTFPE